jgi:putative permease
MHQKGSSSNKEWVRIIFFFSIILIIGGALLSLPRAAIPLMIAYVIYLIVNPAMPTLAKLGLSKLVSILFLFLALTFFLVYPIVKVVPTITKEARDLKDNIPKIERYLETQYGKTREFVKEKVGYEIPNKYISQGIEVAREGTGNFLLNLPRLLASVIEWTVLVPLFLFVMLKEAASFKRSFLRLAPNSIFERFYYLSHKFNSQLGDYIFAKFVEASIVGIIITSGLLILGIKFSLLLGLVAGLTNVIPYVGPILGTIPAIVLGFAEYGPTPTTGAIVLLYLVANTIDIGIVFPILVSKIVDLHPIIVVMSVILGSQYLGILGMVVSIPVAAAVKLIVIEIYNEVYSDRTK